MLSHNALLPAILFGVCYPNQCHVATGSILPQGPSFIHKTRGGSTRALDKDAILNNSQQSKDNLDFFQSHDDNREEDLVAGHEESATVEDAQDVVAEKSHPVEEILYVTKKDGTMDRLDEDKIIQRLKNLSTGLDLRFISLAPLAKSILQGTYPNITTSEIDTLASETSASKSTQHPDYTRLAARICATANHKSTCSTFSEAMLLLNEGGSGFVNNEIADLVKRRGKEIDEKIRKERDLEMTYFGFKTLERSYLLKSKSEKVEERPQYMWMRVALGIHCCKSQEAVVFTKEE